MASQTAQQKPRLIVLGKRICKLFLVRYFRRGVIFMPTGPTDWQKKNQDILKEAFNRTSEQQRDQKAKKAIDDRRAAGSQMVKKQALSPNGPTPPRSTRHQVVRDTYKRDLTEERAKEQERQRKAQAKIDDAKRQAAAQAKQNQQKQAAANHKMYGEINKAKAEITGKQPSNMVKSDINKSSGGREGR